MSYIEDTIKKIEPLYEDKDKIIVNFTDYAYLEQDKKHREWKDKKVYRSRLENLDYTLKEIV